MPSQYERRKQKDESSRELTHETFDVIHDKQAKKYFGVVVRYNPETGDAEVMEKLPVSRSVALFYDQKKAALKRLIKA